MECVLAYLHVCTSPRLCVSCLCVRHSRYNRVLSALVCLNGQHHREPVHLFNQSLTGGENTQAGVCLTSQRDRGRQATDWTLGGMTFDPVGVSSQWGADVHILSPSLSHAIFLSACLHCADGRQKRLNRVQRGIKHEFGSFNKRAVLK